MKSTKLGSGYSEISGDEDNSNNTVAVELNCLSNSFHNVFRPAPTSDHALLGTENKKIQLGYQSSNARRGGSPNLTRHTNKRLNVHRSSRSGSPKYAGPGWSSIHGS